MGKPFRREKRARLALTETESALLAWILSEGLTPIASCCEPQDKATVTRIKGKLAVAMDAAFPDCKIQGGR